MKTREIIPLVILLIILIGGTVFYFTIFQEARMSVLAVCEPEKAEEKGFIVVGVTVFDIIDGEEVIEFYILRDDPDRTILKHELCHVHQLSSRKIQFRYGCEGRDLVGLYLSEIEAYSAQRFSDNLFERIYGFDLDDFS